MRELTPADAFLLRVATWLNLHWSGERFTFREVDDDLLVLDLAGAAGSG